MDILGINKNKQVALFVAVNAIFSVYLMISVEALSGILLLCFSAVALFICNRGDKDSLLNLPNMRIHKGIFSQIISLIPFNVKFMDLEGNVLVSNSSAISVDLGVVLDEFKLKDTKIIKAKIDNKIYHFFVYQGAIYGDDKQVVAHLQVELVMNDILQYLNADNIKEFSENEKVVVAFSNLNDALGIYQADENIGRRVISNDIDLTKSDTIVALESSANVGDSMESDSMESLESLESNATNALDSMESLESLESLESNTLESMESLESPHAFAQNNFDNNGQVFITSPSFDRMLDFVDMGQGSYILDLFHPSERARVEAILSSLGGEGTLFETLMINDSGTFPVEINANTISLDSKHLVNLNIRNITQRKDLERKRDRARILKIAQNETLQKIHILYLALDRMNGIFGVMRDAVNTIINEHNEMQNELNNIIALQERALEVVNEIVKFYSQSDIKTMVDIAQLIDNIKNVIFTKFVLNNTTISVLQNGNAGEFYCDKSAIKAVLVAILRNAVEHINFAKGSNFYGKIIVELEELNDDSLLLSIEDNGGGIDEAHLERCFDAFYTTRNGKVGLGLSTCKVIVEDLLNGEIMAMNTDGGFRVEITLPKG